jgi:hypothetical protein
MSLEHQLATEAGSRSTIRRESAEQAAASLRRLTLSTEKRLAASQRCRSPPGSSTRGDHVSTAVNVDNFVRAETDRMFFDLQRDAGGVNVWNHSRAPRRSIARP